jgi:hypothetical protein
MKRFSIILLAIAVALVMALPVGAKGPPEGKGKPEPGGYTCEDYGFDTPVVHNLDGSFTLEVTGREQACVDVVAPKADWTVTVDEAEGVRRVTIRVQDSVAGGDLCGGDMITGVLNKGEERTLSQIPDATVNACGVEYGEWIRGETGELELEPGETAEENPLAFLVFGQKGTFKITVDPDPETSGE